MLLLAGVSFALSQTLVVPALTAVSAEFDASATATSWVLTGFLLSASVATPNSTSTAVSTRPLPSTSPSLPTIGTIGATPIPSEGAYEAAFVMSAAGALLAIGAALLVPRPAAAAAARRAAVQASA